MWGEWDTVGWAVLRHNYGSAKDVPGLLRRCAGPDPRDAERAADDLLNNLFHQGGWICSAATAALPYLVRLAATPDVPSRRTLLGIVSRLVSEAGQVAEQRLDPGWPAAWERALPEVLALLDAADPAVRRDAADVIGSCRSPGELTLPALLRRWEVEDDPATRLDLVLALGRAALQEPSGEHGAEARSLLRGLLDAPEAQTRLAAVHAIAPGDPGLPAQRIDILLEAVRDPGVELWQHTSTVESGVQGVHHWTAALLTGPSPTFTLGLLDDHPDVGQRVGGLARAGGLLARWCSPATALLPRLAARLDDPAAEVRFRAAELLACLGPVAAPYAHDVAALLGDTGVRDTRRGETVAEAAVWALARMNDPRCVPGLIEAGARPRSGFASNSAHYPSADWHYPVLPALHEVVGHLPDHAELLLPMILGRLDAAAEVHVLHSYCEVLADWGPTAEPAVPHLLGLLEDDRAWTAAATALAGIGTPGRAARELLSARSRPGDAHAELAAWACWKAGGEPGPVLEALDRTLTADGFPRPALRILADLGAHAARYADPLRTMAAGTGAWPRVEAAHALWAVTGDTENTVPALTTAVRGLAEGASRPVMLPAVRHLARIGPAARPAAELLREVPARDQRLGSSGGWRGFLGDESIRAAVEELLAACDVEGLAP
ncbi:HEAT repeat domain-containing protein [Streptomyces sp. NBC_00059]|uniref:HEAT repeat domain-containing protein n=1 Tax=Streptomyces sp. NBC_00059 TaxID=2975635 RepID=UPI002252E57A|nr:HEAT repeat domain-containing protein [Streptomyces sp. NBC_00059]MCX5415159.1 HEAT repeat domain-containing protein [Streptomyces sp. NBC_00059]